MSGIPSKEQLINWLRDNPGLAGKREIAQAFGIKGAARIELKRLLRELAEDGHLARPVRRSAPRSWLPPVAMLVAGAPDADGDQSATPRDWEGTEPPPPILYIPKKGDPALGKGDRFLAKLHAVQADGQLSYEARLIKKISAAPTRLLGIYRAGAEGGRVVPVDKKADREWLIPPGANDGAQDGELVEAEATGGPRLGLPRGRVVARLGDPGAPRSVSLIAMHQHGIAHEFPEPVLAEAAAAGPAPLAGREDLRDLPLVTIDPADARDHDDAVAALPGPNGSWVVWVAIADVAWYVRPGTGLDREARARGNSTYFPDRVSPMLPERLSADLCSLIAGVDRPCLALRMEIDAQGNKTGHRFCRGMMRSPAQLSYETAQMIDDGRDDLVPSAITDQVRALFAAYRAVAQARERRQPLDLDLPERRVILDDAGRVVSVRFRDRFDAHRLIEEFMILANVAAAETLEQKRRPLVYRVHEPPNPDKLDALREMVETLGLSLAKGQVLQTRHLNDLLHQASETDSAELVNISVLRSQTQAYYAPENFGHFGLNLARYAHFTSPIRRYADLIVHRALVSALGLGEGGLDADDIDRLADTATHISQTERRSMEAERDTIDRYLAAYLADRTGAEFSGRIAGVARFGLFVKLDDSGADGLVPISTLGREYFHYDADTQTLTGDRSRTQLGLGMQVTVRLVEAAPVTGGLILELLEVTDGPRLRPGPRRAAGSGPRRVGPARVAAARAARKERRGR